VLEADIRARMVLGCRLDDFGFGGKNAHRSNNPLMCL
jgi:hypothetical protein